MEMPTCPHIERAHKLRDGILVYFDDGRIAFFSAPLLCWILPYAIEFRDADLDGELGSANVEGIDSHDTGSQAE
jgi:hypothetical protein